MTIRIEIRNIKTEDMAAALRTISKLLEGWKYLIEVEILLTSNI